MVFVFCLFLFSTVSASSVSVSANKSSVTRGDSVTITATISAGSGIYTTEGSINCSGAGVTASRDMSFEDMDTKSTSKSFRLLLNLLLQGLLLAKLLMLFLENLLLIRVIL